MYHLTPMAEFRLVGVIRYTTTKPIKTLIYICISPSAHIPNLKLSSYSSGTTKGIWGGYASAKKIPAKQELLLSEITGLPLDAQMQQNRLDVDERVEGSRQCSCSRPYIYPKAIKSIVIHLMSITSKVITSSLAYHGEQSI
jgi:hypothetical protein